MLLRIVLGWIMLFKALIIHKCIKVLSARVFCKSYTKISIVDVNPTFLCLCFLATLRRFFLAEVHKAFEMLIVE